MLIKSNYSKVVDYLFWIVFIIFTNPGSILLALGEDRGDGGINIADLLFFVLCILYSTVFYKKDIGEDKNFSSAVKYLIVFLLYFFFLFIYIVPAINQTDYSSLMFKIIKSRQTVYSIALVIMVYTFYMRSSKIFFNLLLFSTIIIITLFLITLITGVEILPIAKADRHFITIDRIFLDEYGLMPIFIPLGVVLIVFKINIKYRYFILAGFGLMFLTWLLSLTRRHILGTFVYFTLGLIMFNFFQRKSLLPIGKIISVAFYAAIFGFLVFLTFPKYIEAGIVTVEESIYVIEHGEDRTGRKDERFGFKRQFLVNLIKKNPLFGTGFDNRWRTGAGDAMGYESADYPFIAATAMQGFFGLLVFLPIYIILVRCILYDLMFFRNNNAFTDSLEFLIFITFVLYFVFDLLQYMNWFRGVSRSTDHEWFIYFSLYLASRHLYYYKHFSNKNKFNTTDD